jgi:hypothetical protein
MSVDQVIDMIAMRDRRVSTTGTMDMSLLVSTAVVTRSTTIRVRGGDFDHVFVHVIAMRMLKMSVI